MSRFKFTGFPSSLKSESIRETGWLFKGASDIGRHADGALVLAQRLLELSTHPFAETAVFYSVQASKTCYNVLGEILAGF